MDTPATNAGDHGYRLERLASLSSELADQIYAAHQCQFESTRADHPSFQGMHRAEFDGVIAAPGSFVFVVWDGLDIAGHAVVCRDLDAMWWVSPPYFEKHFAAEFTENRLFFVVALGTRHGTPPAVLNALIDGLSRAVATVSGTVIADFAGDNTEKFARYIAARSHVHTEITWQRLGLQSYHAFRTSDLREVGLDFREALATHEGPV